MHRCTKISSCRVSCHSAACVGNFTNRSFVPLTPTKAGCHYCTICFLNRTATALKVKMVEVIVSPLMVVLSFEQAFCIRWNVLRAKPSTFIKSPGLSKEQSSRWARETCPRDTVELFTRNIQIVDKKFINIPAIRQIWNLPILLWTTPLVMSESPF